MSYYYPQAAAKLTVLFDNPGDKDPNLAVSHTISVVPKRVSVNINDYRQADTFQMELDYKCFPFDPRLIRGLGVSIYIEDMKKMFDSNNSLSVIKPSESNVIFAGFADEESIEFNETTRVVSLEGRDFTGLLLDTPYPYGTVDTAKPLDEIIRGFLLEKEAFEKITVDNRTNQDLTALGKFAGDIGATNLGTNRNTKRGESYWDVITALCDRAGIIAFIEIDKLVLMKPRNLYDNTSRTYQFIYGRNLSSLSFQRKLSKLKGFNVRMRSLLPENGSGEPVLTAEIPREATTEWGARMGIPVGKNAEIKTPIASQNRGEPAFKVDPAPFMAFNVPNISNKDHLIELGEKVYEELGRQQIEGELETKEMCVMQGGVEFDIRKIRNGTPVRIQLAQDELEQTRQLGNSYAKRVAYLLDRGYRPAIANALAAALGKYQTTFYTKSVEYTLDSAQGFSMRLNFLNFVDLVKFGL